MENSFECSFKKSHRKIVWPLSRVKSHFSRKFLENLIFWMPAHPCATVALGAFYCAYLTASFDVKISFRWGSRQKLWPFYDPGFQKNFRNFRVNQSEWIHRPIKEYRDIKIVKSNVLSPFPIQFMTPFGHNYEFSSISFN